MDCAGAAARIEQVDGQVEESAFPVTIAPQLVIDGLIKPVHPFEEMHTLAHEVTPGVWAEVRFSGEIFETEDQRNWTDASYKTYGTPLRLLFPVEITNGTKVAQSVTLTVQGLPSPTNAHRSSSETQHITTFRIQGATQSTKSKIPIPQLGLGTASHGQQLDEQSLARLRALHLAHLRVDLHLDQPDYAKALQRATEEARALAGGLEIALHVTDAAESELRTLAGQLDAMRPPVRRWLVFHVDEKTTGEGWVTLARQILSGYDANAPIGAGTNVYFTELNCQRPPVHVLDVVAYSFNPQVHAFDNASLAETLAAQAATAQSARQFCADRPLAIGPVTLQPRFNPNATGPELEPAPGELPPQVDVRQMSLFGAGWTLGSIKYLAESGEVDSITYYETTGWRGVMETADGSPLPEKFRSLPGSVFPMYHIFADIGEFDGGEVIASTSSRPLSVDGLVLQKNGRRRTLLANLTSEPQTVQIEGLAGPEGAPVQVRILDETNAIQAMQEPEMFRATGSGMVMTQAGNLAITLPPYAVVRIDAA
jgi:hypothetical protein